MFLILNYSSTECTVTEWYCSLLLLVVTSGLIFTSLEKTLKKIFTKRPAEGNVCFLVYKKTAYKPPPLPRFSFDDLMRSGGRKEMSSILADQ